MTAVGIARPATLIARWYEYAGGPSSEVTGVTITITRISTAAVVLGPTATGVSTPALGVNAYTWTPAVSVVPDEYLVTWTGTDSDAEEVTAVETISVTTAVLDGDSYATLAQFKRRLGIPDSKTTSDLDLQDKLDGATEDINRWCGRAFWRQEDASIRSYRVGRTGVDTDDFWSSDDLSITPYLGATAGTPWTVAGVALEPLNGVVDGMTGWPYRRIAYGWSMASFYSAGLVQVSARWGWAEVPKPVVTACMLIAAMDNKAGDAPFGVAGFGDYALRIRANPMAEEKLRPFVKDPAKVAS